MAEENPTSEAVVAAVTEDKVVSEEAVPATEATATEAAVTEAAATEAAATEEKVAPEAKEAVVRVEGSTLHGTMKTWNVDKGFGFMECTDGGTDIFVHQSIVKVDVDRYRAVCPGTDVTVVHYLRDGKEAAKECASKDGSNLPGFDSKIDASEQIKFSLRNPGMLKGTVKFMNRDKGYGFISPQSGGEDVFVHVHDVEGQIMLESGETVLYTLAEKKEKSKPQAVTVKCTSRPPMDYGYDRGYGPRGGGYGPPRGGYEERYRPPPTRAPGVKVDTGKVKWFNDTKGFGFIVPASGSDVYFKGIDVLGGGPPLEPDEPVTYETKQGEDTKVWAMGVMRVNAPPRSAKRARDPEPMGYGKRPHYDYDPYYGGPPHDAYGYPPAPYHAPYPPAPYY